MNNKSSNETLINHIGHLRKIDSEQQKQILDLLGKTFSSKLKDSNKEMIVSKKTVIRFVCEKLNIEFKEYSELNHFVDDYMNVYFKPASFYVNLKKNYQKNIELIKKIELEEIV